MMSLCTKRGMHLHHNYDRKVWCFTKHKQYTCRVKKNDNICISNQNTSSDVAFTNSSSLVWSGKLIKSCQNLATRGTMKQNLELLLYTWNANILNPKSYAQYTRNIFDERHWNFQTCSALIARQCNFKLLWKSMPHNHYEALWKCIVRCAWIFS